MTIEQDFGSSVDEILTTIKDMGSRLEALEVKVTDKVGSVSDMNTTKKIGPDADETSEKVTKLEAENKSLADKLAAFELKEKEAMIKSLVDNEIAVGLVSKENSEARVKELMEASAEKLAGIESTVNAVKAKLEESDENEDESEEESVVPDEGLKESKQNLSRKTTQRLSAEQLNQNMKVSDEAFAELLARDYRGGVK